MMELALCTDCTLVNAGYDEHEMGVESIAPSVAGFTALEDVYRAEGEWVILSPKTVNDDDGNMEYTDEYFSYSRCDICESSLGGDRTTHIISTFPRNN